MTPKALLSLLFNGSKALDVVRTALDLGLLDALEPGPVSLRTLAEEYDAVPTRLYKFLDCLECVGLVRRFEPTGDVLDAEYALVPGAGQAAVDVLGPASIERDRDRYPWTRLHGRLPEVLRGEVSIPADEFAWPPSNADQIETFERSMAAGLGPILETFRAHAARLRNVRLLDVGGGDGTLAARLLAEVPSLTVDVYNLPAVEPLVHATRTKHELGGRLGFVGGDFLAEPLPAGYGAMSFVRVLHDWPLPTAKALLAKAFAALEPGGQVLVCEEFRTAERLAGQFFWSYFLLGVDQCSSMLREAAQYARLLTEVGFREVETLPGPFELIVATR